MCKGLRCGAGIWPEQAFEHRKEGRRAHGGPLFYVPYLLDALDNVPAVGAGHCRRVIVGYADFADIESKPNVAEGRYHALARVLVRGAGFYARVGHLVDAGRRVVGVLGYHVVEVGTVLRFCEQFVGKLFGVRFVARACRGGVLPRKPTASLKPMSMC